MKTNKVLADEIHASLICLSGVKEEIFKKGDFNTYLQLAVADNIMSKARKQLLKNPEE